MFSDEYICEKRFQIINFKTGLLQPMECNLLDLLTRSRVIRKTYHYDVYPLIPHFYIAKLRSCQPSHLHLYVYMTGNPAIHMRFMFPE